MPIASPARPRPGEPDGVAWLPIAWALGSIIVFGVGFFQISWPYVDAYTRLNEADRWTWQQHLPYAFGGGTEYRPLMVLSIKAAYEALGLHLWAYQTLVLLQLAAVLGLLLWLLRPVGRSRGIAAVIALSCVLGLHTSRILFLFVPLNAHSGALALVLLTVALAFHPRVRTLDWIFLPLTFVALLLLESSLLIVPAVVVLWRLGAPGLSGRGVVATGIAVLLYVVVRAAFGASQELSVYTASGLGFSARDPDTLRAIFEHAPYVFWIYNVVATFLTVVLSEPRDGMFASLASLLAGNVPLWRWWHVGSSVVTTSVIAIALIRHPAAAVRDRLLLGSGLVLVVFGSALGFLYTRDRIGLCAGVGYVMILYVALAGVWEQSPRSAPKRLGWAAVTLVIGFAWLVRSAETYLYLRDTAWDYHLEWTRRFEELGGLAQTESNVLTSMMSTVLSRTPDDPRRDPSWTYTLFERRHARHVETPSPTNVPSAN